MKPGNAVIGRGRFVLDLLPVSKFGAIFRWVAQDLDTDEEASGLCADAESGFAECMTFVWKQVRK